VAERLLQLKIRIAFHIIEKNAKGGISETGLGEKRFEIRPARPTWRKKGRKRGSWSKSTIIAVICGRIRHKWQARGESGKNGEAWTILPGGPSWGSLIVMRQNKTEGPRGDGVRGKTTSWRRGTHTARIMVERGAEVGRKKSGKDRMILLPWIEEITRG